MTQIDKKGYTIVADFLLAPQFVQLFPDNLCAIVVPHLQYWKFTNLCCTDLLKVLKKVHNLNGTLCYGYHISANDIYICGYFSGKRPTKILQKHGFSLTSNVNVPFLMIYPRKVKIVINQKANVCRRCSNNKFKILRNSYCYCIEKLDLKKNMLTHCELILTKKELNGALRNAIKAIYKF